MTKDLMTHKKKLKSSYDLIVIGGGTSGVAAAVTASKKGVHTLLIEKNSFLGGAMTGALVSPMMKNIDNTDKNINHSLLNEVLAKLSKTNDSAIHPNGNNGWFNPEMMKIVLDEICIENNVNILLETTAISVKTSDKEITSIKTLNKEGLQKISARYYIDATGDGDIAKLSGINCYEVSKEEHQSISLRFNMSGVNIQELSNWLLKIDKNRAITSSYTSKNNQVLLTTAYTWDKNDWALKPIFQKAIKNGDLTKEDSAYFQIFSIPGQNSTITFNCPRIHSDKFINPLNAKDRSNAYIRGRKQIFRLANFCKKYIKGFQDAYISNIANDLGIRVSRRISGDYILTKDDIKTAKKFPNPVLRSNYPLDIHSDKKNESTLEELNKKEYYEVPKASLYSKDVQNLIIIGKSISADFMAQSSLRIQPNCWCMGEYAGNLIYKLMKG